MSEVELYAPAGAVERRDLRDVATDSWTSVLDDVVNLAKGIAGTEFVPVGLRGSVAKVTAAVLHGRELGLPPMTALGSIAVIEGKASLSAEAMRALILQAGHDLRIDETTPAKCVISGRRKGSDTWTTISATKSEFDQVKMKVKGQIVPLTAKSNWRNYPSEMLLARATTKLARAMFADVIHGLRSSEELADMTSVDAGEVVEVEAPKVVRRRTSAALPAERTQTSETVEMLGERRRVGRPAERVIEPDSKSEPEGESVDVELVDAEIVEEPDVEPEAPVEVEVVEPAPIVPSPRISQGLVGIIAQHFNRLGVTERAERLMWINQLAGTSVESSKSLTQDEGQQIVKRIEKLRDREALEALAGADS